MRVRSIAVAATGACLVLSLVGAPASAASFKEETPYSQSAFAAAQKAGGPILVHVTAPCVLDLHGAKADRRPGCMPSPAFSNYKIFNVDFDTEKPLLRKLGVRMQSTLIVYKGRQGGGPLQRRHRSRRDQGAAPEGGVGVADLRPGIPGGRPLDLFALRDAAAASGAWGRRLGAPLGSGGARRRPGDLLRGDRPLRRHRRFRDRAGRRRLPQGRRRDPRPLRHPADGAGGTGAARDGGRTCSELDGAALRRLLDHRPRRPVRRRPAARRGVEAPVSGRRSAPPPCWPRRARTCRASPSP